MCGGFIFMNIREQEMGKMMRAESWKVMGSFLSYRINTEFEQWID